MDLLGLLLLCNWILCKVCEFHSKLVICTEIIVSCSAARILGGCVWPRCFCTNTSLQFTMLPQQQQQLRLLPHLAAAEGCSKRKNAATEALEHAASSSWHPMLCILWILLTLLKPQKKHLQWTIRTISRDTFCNNSSPRSRRNSSTKKQAIRTSSKSPVLSYCRWSKSIGTKLATIRNQHQRREMVPISRFWASSSSSSICSRSSHLEGASPKTSLICNRFCRWTASQSCCCNCLHDLCMFSTMFCLWRVSSISSSSSSETMLLID